MADHGPASGEADSSSPLWRAVRRLFLHGDGEQSLRAQLEEAIDEHEDDGGDSSGSDGDLSPLEREMLRNVLHFSEHNAAISSSQLAEDGKAMISPLTGP